MSAILFGSISTIADTSERQRDAFNRAFAAHGLDWQWDQDEYRALLRESGGEGRIAQYARAHGQTVDAHAVHRTKSELFQSGLADAQVPARAGVTEIVREATRQGMKVALVTTTSRENVASLLRAMDPDFQEDDFDLIVDASRVKEPKPDRAVYLYALESLHETPDHCVAIEDNLGGVQAAKAAGLRCVAFPNQNTATHDFDSADQRVDQLGFDQLRSLLPVA